MEGFLPVVVAVAMAAAGCAQKPESAPVDTVAAKTQPAGPKPLRCRQLPFASEAMVAEASGAAYLPGPPPRIVVVSDSGNDGEYVSLDPISGKEIGRGRLALDKIASDDIEGLAFAGGKLFTLTSSGWMREFTLDGDKFVAAGAAYPIGDAASGTVCAQATGINCGPNYEDLCVLGTANVDGCVGYAAAKTSGKLYCLAPDPAGHLRISKGPDPVVFRPKTLAGCSMIPGKPEIWIGANVLGANAVGVIRGGLTARPDIEWLGPLGPGNGEAIVMIPDGSMVRFSDLGESPSLMLKYRCE